jgi:hypothetical protein
MEIINCTKKLSYKDVLLLCSDLSDAWEGAKSGEHRAYVANRRGEDYVLLRKCPSTSLMPHPSLTEDSITIYDAEGES